VTKEECKRRAKINARRERAEMLINRTHIAIDNAVRQVNNEVKEVSGWKKVLGKVLNRII